MKKKENKTAYKIAGALDLPLDVLCDIPRTEIMGCSQVCIENFRGILGYEETCIKINSNTGIIKIEGDGLYIESITDEGVFIKGRILRIEFL